MATVSKCDRCGKYVDRTGIPKILGYKNPDRCVPEKDINMDLCPGCYALLRNFLGYTNQTEGEE